MRPPAATEAFWCHIEMLLLLARTQVPLKPALPESFEGALHDIQASVAKDFATAVMAADGGDGSSDGTLFCFNTSFDFASAQPFPASAPAAVAPSSAVAQGLAAMLEGDAPRLQRWVGVSYKPDTERQSHYGEMVLRKCYDQVRPEAAVQSSGDKKFHRLKNALVRRGRVCRLRRSFGAGRLRRRVSGPCPGGHSCSSCGLRKR